MKNILILILFFIAAQMYCQDFNSWLENYAFDTDDETSREELIDLWNEKSIEKLNLNTATRDQLEEFSFLSSKQIENLLEYRFDYKEFLTIYELNLIEGDYLWKRLTHLKTVNYLSLHYN